MTKNLTSGKGKKEIPGRETHMSQDQKHGNSGF